jgi:hypothetical protein
MPVGRNGHESGDICTISLALDRSPVRVKVAHFEIGDNRRPKGFAADGGQW